MGRHKCCLARQRSPEAQEKGTWALTMGGMAAARCFSCFRSSGFWGEPLALVSLARARRLGRGDSSLRVRPASGCKLSTQLQPWMMGLEGPPEGRRMSRVNQDCGGGEQSQGFLPPSSGPQRPPEGQVDSNPSTEAQAGRPTLLRQSKASPQEAQTRTQTMPSPSQAVGGPVS